MTMNLVFDMYLRTLQDIGWRRHVGRRQNVMMERMKKPEDTGCELCHLPAMWLVSLNPGHVISLS